MTCTTTKTVVSAHNCGRYMDLSYLGDLAEKINREERQRSVVVETTYLGPTDTKGSRVKAKVFGTRFSNTIGLDHSLSLDVAHLQSALACLALWIEREELTLTGIEDTEKGFLFFFSCVDR